MYVPRNPGTKASFSNNAVLNLLCLFKSHIQTRSASIFSYICSVIPLDLYNFTSLIVTLFGLSVGANYSVDIHKYFPVILDVS